MRTNCYDSPEHLTLFVATLCGGFAQDGIRNLCQGADILVMHLDKPGQLSARSRNHCSFHRRGRWTLNSVAETFDTSKSLASPSVSKCLCCCLIQGEPALPLTETGLGPKSKMIFFNSHYELKEFAPAKLLSEIVSLNRLSLGGELSSSYPEHPDQKFQADHLDSV